MDPLSDMIVRIKNAMLRGKETMDLPASRMKGEVLRVLKEEGYISAFRLFKDGKKSTIKVLLKYAMGKAPVITDMRRISKPSSRIYRGYREFPRIRGGIGVNVISTTRGVMTDRSAKKLKVGGELLLQVW